MSFQLPEQSSQLIARGVASPAGIWQLEAGNSEPDADQRSQLPTVGPGQVAVLAGEPGLGMTRLGLVMLSGYTGGTVAYLDVRGWLSPVAAWEVGIEPDRLVIARCHEVVRWGRAAAALLDGATAVLAEVPAGVKDASIRKLAALARNRGTTLLLRPIGRAVPIGVAHLVLEARDRVEGRCEWARSNRAEEDPDHRFWKGHERDDPDDRDGGRWLEHSACGIRSGRYGDQERRRMSPARR